MVATQQGNCREAQQFKSLEGVFSSLGNGKGAGEMAQHLCSSRGPDSIPSTQVRGLPTASDPSSRGSNPTAPALLPCTNIYKNLRKMRSGEMGRNVKGVQVWGCHPES